MGAAISTLVVRIAFAMLAAAMFMTVVTTRGRSVFGGSRGGFVEELPVTNTTHHRLKTGDGKQHYT